MSIFLNVTTENNISDIVKYDIMHAFLHLSSRSSAIEECIATKKEQLCKGCMSLPYTISSQVTSLSTQLVQEDNDVESDTIIPQLACKGIQNTVVEHL